MENEKKNKSRGNVLESFYKSDTAYYIIDLP